MMLASNTRTGSNINMMLASNTRTLIPYISSWTVYRSRNYMGERKREMEKKANQRGFREETGGEGYIWVLIKENGRHKER